IKLTPRLFQEDNQYLDNLIWLVKRWKEQTDLALSKIRRFNVKQVDSNYRLLQVIRAIDTTLEQGSDSKVLVFSAWLQTIETLLPHILRIYGKASVAQFTCRLPIEELQNQADIFQGDNNCQILLCDELGGEGRNFQIANSIVHVDLPWTPTQLEQRIGRVDRLGRKGSVLSIVPFAKDWSEQDLFMIWQEAFQLFTQSMSGLEIALEGIQHELVEALWRSPRHGLAELLTDMIGRAAKLREDVEEERYFDEVAINYNRRAGFQEISQKYRDGKMLRKSFMGWANLIGLSHSYDQKTDTLWFNPKKFSRASMTNAKLLRLPDMQEALRRSGRHHDLKIKGTFNRDIAIRREDLVFFAPGNDPWTDAIVANAIQADSGRCCAVGRVVPELTKDWEGFELFYSFAINPRPLYEAGYDPIHLFRALGFLRKPTYRLLISKDGEIIARSSPIWRYIKDFDKRTDLHLGKRDGTEAQIFAFKTNHPPEEWHSTLTQIFKIAEGALNEELDFMTEMAEEARVEFERHAIGWMAANRWRYGGVENTQVLKEIRDYEIASAALVEGINHPLCQLESVCYWVLNHKADK
ncbi:MAG: C-terminal helicase domain-containing protein, partial [Chloroflexota bacterium]